MLAGLVWSGFRPSDDPSQLAYPIPANMYAAAGLERALELNRQVGHKQLSSTELNMARKARIRCTACCEVGHATAN